MDWMYFHFFIKRVSVHLDFLRKLSKCYIQSFICHLWGFYGIFFNCSEGKEQILSNTHMNLWIPCLQNTQNMHRHVIFIQVYHVISCKYPNKNFFCVYFLKLRVLLLSQKFNFKYIFKLSLWKTTMVSKEKAVLHKNYDAAFCTPMLHCQNTDLRQTWVATARWTVSKIRLFSVWPRDWLYSELTHSVTIPSAIGCHHNRTLF